MSEDRVLDLGADQSDAPRRVQPSIEDTFRRIGNILDVCPAEDWEPEDAREVLATLSLIAFRRQAAGRVRPLRSLS